MACAALMLTSQDPLRDCWSRRLYSRTFPPQPGIARRDATARAGIEGEDYRPARSGEYLRGSKGRRFATGLKGTSRVNDWPVGNSLA